MADDVDEWGVPIRMFGGPIPDDFAAGVARVALLSALLEAKVLGLISTVSAEPQDALAGRPVEGQLRTLEGIAEAGMPARVGAAPALNDNLRAVVSSIREDVRQRNEVLHTVWPLPRLEGGVGWKPLPPKQRDQPWDWTRGVSITDDQIPALIGRLVAHVDAIDGLRERAEMLPRASR